MSENVCKLAQQRNRTHCDCQSSQKHGWQPSDTKGTRPRRWQFKKTIWHSHLASIDQFNWFKSCLSSKFQKHTAVHRKPRLTTVLCSRVNIGVPSSLEPQRWIGLGQHLFVVIYKCMYWITQPYIYIYGQYLTHQKLDSDSMGFLSPIFLGVSAF